MKIVPLAREDLDRLEPLWGLLHAHHQSVAPELAPYVEARTSWVQRRTRYEEAFKRQGGGFLVQDADLDVGYAVYGVQPRYRPATFAEHTDVLELYTLFVRPEYRGRHIGSMLSEAVDASAAAEGLVTQMVGVVPGNSNAVSFFTKRGFAPTWLTLTRFGRSQPFSRSHSNANIKTVTRTEVDRLRALWLTLHHHHQDVASVLGPFVSDEASWDVIRQLFQRTATEGVLLWVEEAGAPIAVACTTISRNDTSISETWLSGRDVAEVKVLVVANHVRGRGIGSALLHSVQRRLSSIGVDDMMIAAIYPNQDAIRLYQRQGFRPAWLEMTRALPSVSGVDHDTSKVCDRRLGG